MPAHNSNQDRPTDRAGRLERLRQRNNEQLAAQREAERKVDAALKSYVKAETTVADIEQERDDKITALRGQIEKAEDAARTKVDQVRQQQAMSVWELNNAGRTLEQIAELLEVSVKEARRLLGAGRKARAEKPTNVNEDRANSAKPAAQAEAQRADAAAQSADRPAADGDQPTSSSPAEHE